MSTSTETPLGRVVRLGSLLCGGVIIAMLVAWVLDDPATNLATDWTAFDNASERLFGDESIYRSYEEEPLPYLYPPSALWLTLPLRFVGFGGSFLLSAGLSLGAALLGVRELLRCSPSLHNRRAATTAAVMSGAMISSTLIGQYAGLWLLALALGLRLWIDGRLVPAGFALSLLMLKPNLGIAVLVVLVWSRAWPALRGFLAGVGGLLLLSLPFGFAAWSGFASNLVETTQVQVDGQVFARKHITMHATLELLTGLESTSLVLQGTWLLVVGFLGVAVLQLWTDRAREQSIARAFGGLSLFIVAASPRLYFYDGLILLVPALVWWGSGSLWFTSERGHRVMPWLLGFGWVGAWGGVFADLNRFVGPISSVVLAIWAHDSWKNRVEGPMNHERLVPETFSNTNT